MLRTLPQPTQPSLLTAKEAESPLYYVAWRIRKHHPWQSEEFDNRFQAQSRYFALLERGLEAYWERRQPALF